MELNSLMKQSKGKVKILTQILKGNRVHQKRIV